tara:strand:+ start:406 stop:657 length:252 start_codon:yes stop_codon:yes gene_type:complete
MGVTTMKELCEYSKQQQILRAAVHRRKHAHEGLCSGLTDAEYNRVVTRQKSTFSKARKFTHNRMWQETSKNYSVEQLKTIVKS